MVEKVDTHLSQSHIVKLTFISGITAKPGMGVKIGQGKHKSNTAIGRKVCTEHALQELTCNLRRAPGTHTSWTRGVTGTLEWPMADNVRRSPFAYYPQLSWTMVFVLE